LTIGCRRSEPCLFLRPLRRPPSSGQHRRPKVDGATSRTKSLRQRPRPWRPHLLHLQWQHGRVQVLRVEPQHRTHLHHGRDSGNGFLAAGDARHSGDAIRQSGSLRRHDVDCDARRHFRQRPSVRSTLLSVEDFGERASEQRRDHSSAS